MPCFPFCGLFFPLRLPDFFVPLFTMRIFCWEGMRRKRALDELKKLRSNFDLSWTGGGHGSVGTMGINALPIAAAPGKATV
jgi:hypothetical protein